MSDTSTLQIRTDLPVFDHSFENGVFERGMKLSEAMELAGEFCANALNTAAEILPKAVGSSRS
jgi:hypothetical protein